MGVWQDVTEKNCHQQSLPFKVSAGDLEITSFNPFDGENNVCRNMAIDVKTNQPVKPAHFDEAIKLVDLTSLLTDPDFKDLVFRVHLH